MVIGALFAAAVTAMLWKSSQSEPYRPENHIATPAEIESAKKREVEFQMVRLGLLNLRGSMKKPETFELVSAALMRDGAVCYEYKARNSFNDVTTGQYVMIRPAPFTGSDRISDWNKHCAGKSGSDYSMARAAL